MKTLIHDLFLVTYKISIFTFIVFISFNLYSQTQVKNPQFESFVSHEKISSEKYQKLVELNNDNTSSIIFYGGKFNETSNKQAKVAIFSSSEIFYLYESKRNYSTIEMISINLDSSDLKEFYLNLDDLDSFPNVKYIVVMIFIRLIMQLHLN
jgi:hypothetical protein